MTRQTRVMWMLVLVCGVALDAQYGGQTNRASPHETMTKRVAGTQVTIVYGRPSMRGRQIFGRLVPYGRIWCPGADDCTTLSSTKALQMGGVNIPPGPHTLWILPTADRWTLIVSQEPAAFHTRYPSNRDLGRFEMAKRTLATSVEQLTFDVVEGSEANTGVLTMSWENTEVRVPFRVVN